MGVMFGNPEVTTGGRALKFYSSVRMEIRRAEQIKEGDLVKGNRTRIKIVKNKVAPPFRQVEFDIMYGEGISEEGDLLDLAVTANLVEKSGAWFSINGERMGQGRDAGSVRVQPGRLQVAVELPAHAQMDGRQVDQGIERVRLHHRQRRLGGDRRGRP